MGKPWSNLWRVGSRRNRRFSSSKTLRVERLENLEEEAISHDVECSVEDNEEFEGEGDTRSELLWPREVLGSVKSEEVEDIMRVKKCLA